ncbi:DDB1- and CUL4-associated factor 8 [Microplitis demolitor]|uniref:DDB1- and CUL4-associated factor 8 n=1 Tax=Microplitis demolitor TaxID=69319 RepID=UPI0006D4F3F0|nr:DDB1- and CUL4-associated factor 8 [Microplitis demolitor]
MDTNDNDLEANKNGNDKNKSTECCDNNKINENVSTTMELENKNDENSLVEGTVINNLSMDFDDTTIDKNNISCNNHNKIDERNECETENEPLEKKYKKSKNSNSNNINGSLVTNDNNLPDNSNNDNNLVDDMSNNTGDTSNKILSETKDNDKSLESPNVNKDEPSCSNVKITKPKSELKKRHYRKSSDNNEDLDSKSGKKARDSNSSSQELDSSVDDESHVLESENSKKSDHDKNSDSDDADNMISSVKDDDSDEWSTASEEEVGLEIPEVLTKAKPKPKWFMLPEMRSREIGNNRFFNRKFYGSLRTVQRLEIMHKLDEHEGCVNALNFNEDGSRLASGSDDLEVVIWDWAVGKKRGVFETGHSLNVFEVKWLPIDYESFIVTCARDGQIRLLDLNTGVNKKLASHREEARRLATHFDHPYNVLSVGDDGKILSIDIRAEKPTRLLTVKEDGSHTLLYTIHINPRDSNYFCVGGRSQKVKIFDRRRVLEPVHKLCPRNLSVDGQSAYVTSAVYNYNGTEIVTSYNDDDIYLFDTVSPNPTRDYAHKYEGHRNSATVKSVNFFGPKSEFIVSGSDCGNIFFWDKSTEAIVQWMPGDDQGVVNRLEPHPYVPILATSGLDSDVKIWAPSCELEPPMTNLDVCVKTNMKTRSDDTTREPDQFDSRMLAVFLRHISRYGRYSPASRARRLVHARSYDDNSDSSNNSSRSLDSDSHSDDDAMDGPQCTTS